MPLWRVRIYVGPIAVPEVADKIRAALPEGDVLEGTEHVHVNVEAGSGDAAMHNLIVDLNRFHGKAGQFDWLGRRLLKAYSWEVLHEIVRCADCGKRDERIGHQDCQYPQDHA
jgi:hypothetical protein